ncbi:MAG: CDP-alcohol phosphatidyltransferase family protein [Bacteroidales bacterium]|nr:CDP-alcohol phosphatidyltransferase family protein [Bacteroidales bacterium]
MVEKCNFANMFLVKNLANIITFTRILCSVILLFFPVFSFGFYVMYLICGITDMIDGTIARMTNSSSEFGAKFDSFADLIFVLVSFVKILPIIELPKFLWVWIAVIAIIKIINVVKCFASKLILLHTTMNRITGLLLFLLPLTFSSIEMKYSAMFLCFIATITVIREICYLYKKRTLKF